MRIQLKTVLDCEPDAAWRALRSPTVLRELYGPFITTSSLSEAGFPTLWEPGTHTIGMRGAGVLPLGKQHIELRFDDRRTDGIRILTDAGGGVSGPLALLSSWRHRMAVSAVPGGSGKTLYRDRLDIAGPAAAVFWYPLWLMWQWRERRLVEMAPYWAYDPVPEAADGTKG